MEQQGGVRTAVLVVNFASHRLLEENLQQLGRDVPGITVVVVDNYSSSPEREAVRALAGRNGWLLVESPNVGFGSGTNAAAERALAQGATHLLLLNPDARLRACDYQGLLEASLREPRALVAPLLFDAAGTQRAPGRYVRLADGMMTNAVLHGTMGPRTGMIPWLTGACLLVPGELWQDIGGMPEEYFLYWEDVEFSRRALDAGASLVITPGARCVHDQGGTQRPGHGEEPQRKSLTYVYYNARNRYLFASRNLSPSQQRDWRRTSPRAVWHLVRLARGRKAAVLRPAGVWSSVLRGTRDGLRLLPH